MTASVISLHPLLFLNNISRRFGAITALDSVSFSVKHGEVVALLGDNGAGKSTLVKILSGLMKPTSGTIDWCGANVVLRTAKDSRRIGIETIFQDLAVCPELTAAENIFLGREYSFLSFTKKGLMIKEAERLLKKIDSDASPTAAAKFLSGGQRQAVALARVFLGDPKLVLMDEPTAAISVRQVKEVLQLILDLKSRGVSVIVVTHRIHDAFEFADKIIVMRRGEKVADVISKDTNIEEVTSLILGDKKSL